MTPRRLGTIIGLAAALALAWWAGRAPPAEEREPLRGLPTPQPEASVAVAAPPGPISPNAPAHPLAGKLHAPGGSAEQDLEILQTMLMQLRGLPEMRTRPLGLNEDFAAALAGDNPVGLRFIDPAMLDAQGRLLDRWGAPYWFHPLAADRVEIRTAGPDGTLFSEDDVLWTRWPGAGSP